MNNEKTHSFSLIFFLFFLLLTEQKLPIGVFPAYGAKAYQACQQCDDLVAWQARQFLFCFQDYVNNYKQILKRCFKIWRLLQNVVIFASS